MCQIQNGNWRSDDRARKHNRQYEDEAALTFSTPGAMSILEKTLDSFISVLQREYSDIITANQDIPGMLSDFMRLYRWKIPLLTRELGHIVTLTSPPWIKLTKQLVKLFLAHVTEDSLLKIRSAALNLNLNAQNVAESSYTIIARIKIDNRHRINIDEI